ncbi:MAG: hypothetical protein V3S87_10355 [Alphaproteobacteria bacterium]
MTLETHTTAERNLVNRVAERYRRQGYDVLFAPVGEERPKFLSEFEPDLIARRGEESVVVEVKWGERAGSEPAVRKLAAEVARHPGWRLDLVLGRESEGGITVESMITPLAKELVAQLDEGLELCRTDHLAAGTLLIWAAFEGAARFIAAREGLGTAPTTAPLALIRALVSDGLIGDAEYEIIKAAYQRRNGIAHGFASAPEDDETFGRLSTVAQRILREQGSDE